MEPGGRRDDPGSRHRTPSAWPRRHRARRHHRLPPRRRPLVSTGETTRYSGERTECRGEWLTPFGGSGAADERGRFRMDTTATAWPWATDMPGADRGAARQGGGGTRRRCSGRRAARGAATRHPMAGPGRASRRRSGGWLRHLRRRDGRSVYPRRGVGRRAGRCLYGTASTRLGRGDQRLPHRRRQAGLVSASGRHGALDCRCRQITGLARSRISGPASSGRYRCMPGIQGHPRCAARRCQGWAANAPRRIDTGDGGFASDRKRIRAEVGAANGGGSVAHRPHGECTASWRT